MMFIVGAVFMGGGLIFMKQAFDTAKNFFESALFALLGVAAGVWLCLWAVFGIPNS
jgi:hypothetical protein